MHTQTNCTLLKPDTHIHWKLHKICATFIVQSLVCSPKLRRSSLGILNTGCQLCNGCTYIHFAFIVENCIQGKRKMELNVDEGKK